MFQEWGDCVEPTTKVPTLNCIPVVFQNLISGALIFVGITAAFLIVYAGITFIRSGGDPKQVAAARQILTYAIIGVVVVLSSFAIIYFIAYVTGTDCITKLDLQSCT